MVDTANVSGQTAEWILDSAFTRHSDTRPARLQPIALKVALSTVVWFIAVLWLNLVTDIEIDFGPAAGTGLFVMLLTLFLERASIAAAANWVERR